MKIDSDGTTIWWDSYGQGPPVLLLNGLSSSSDAWYRVVPHLSKKFRVITMDNRGVGRSGAPRGRYTMSTMAGDAVKVLDAAGVPAAHVIGISMGSCIAQELAVTAPERVTSLVLASSNPGTRHSKLPSAKVLLLVSSGWFRSYSRFYSSLLPYMYHPKTDPSRVDEDVRASRSEQPSRRGVRGQTFGAVGWDRYADLPQISVPTLVLHGADDRMDPAVNAETLAGRIPGAELAILPNAGHQVFTDQEEAAVESVFTFLVKSDR